MNTSRLYRVHWKSLRTGKTGQGDGTWSKESAQAWADELNARPENSQMKFWIEPFPPAGLEITKEDAQVFQDVGD